MINLIYGAKGSGKTQRIIDDANASVATTKGNIVFITDNSLHTLDIDTRIRFIDVNEFDVKWGCCTLSFIKGMLAANADINKIYVDGFGRFLSMQPEDMEELYTGLEDISTRYNVDFVCTVSTDDVPKFMKKYL